MHKIRPQRSNHEQLRQVWTVNSSYKQLLICIEIKYHNRCFRQNESSYRTEKKAKYPKSKSMYKDLFSIFVYIKNLINLYIDGKSELCYKRGSLHKNYLYLSILKLRNYTENHQNIIIYT